LAAGALALDGADNTLTSLAAGALALDGFDNARGIAERLTIPELTPPELTTVWKGAGDNDLAMGAGDNGLACMASGEGCLATFTLPSTTLSEAAESGESGEVCLANFILPTPIGEIVPEPIEVPTDKRSLDTTLRWVNTLPSICCARSPRTVAFR
jgi:hypothetical protein